MFWTIRSFVAGQVIFKWWPLFIITVVVLYDNFSIISLYGPDRLPSWLINWLPADCLTGWQTDWLADRLTDYLTVWLAGWRTHGKMDRGLKDGWSIILKLEYTLKVLKRKSNSPYMYTCICTSFLITVSITPASVLHNHIVNSKFCHQLNKKEESSHLKQKLKVVHLTCWKQQCQLHVHLYLKTSPSAKIKNWGYKY